MNERLERELDQLQRENLQLKNEIEQLEKKNRLLEEIHRLKKDPIHSLTSSMESIERWKTRETRHTRDASEPE